MKPTQGEPLAEAHGDLLELVRTEQQLDEALAAARAEAARIVEQARAAASRRLGSLDQDLADAVARLRQEAEADLTARLAGLEAAAAGEARRFRALDDAGALELAERLVARLWATPQTAP